MKKRILCYGDSNTYGYNAMGGRFDECDRWPMVMQSDLGTDYRIVEEGFGGRTFAEEDPNEGGFKSGMKYLPPCLMSHNPLELVIVMLGTNDAKQRFGLNAQTIAFNLNEFTRLVRAYGMNQAGSPPKILIVAPPAIGDWVSSSILAGHFGPDAPRITRELPAQLKRFSKLLNCRFFDASQYVTPGPADGVHLPADQHHKLGHLLATEVQKILEG